jgi:lipid A 3-O-deacylase
MAGMLCRPRMLGAQGVTAVGVEVDNDLFTRLDLWAASDYEYTHGIRLWLERTGNTAFLKPVDEWLLPECSARRTPCVTRIQIGQEMYTPRLESSGDPIPGQRAHAGWVHASVSRAARTQRAETEYELQLGVIGPASLAEQTQKAIHKVFGMRNPMGWDHQLPTQPTLQLRVQRSAVVASTSMGSMTPALGYSMVSQAGNALIQMSAAVSTALCYNRSCGSTEMDRHETFSARFVATGGPRVVLHNVFLEGGRRGSAASVDARNIVWLGSAGAAVRWKRLGVAFEKVFRSREYETEPDGFSYGRFRIVLEQ